MNDQVEGAFCLEQLRESFAISDIHLAVAKVLSSSAQPLQIPQCVSFLTEEVRPHVVINANNMLGAMIGFEGTDKL